MRLVLYKGSLKAHLLENDGDDLRVTDYAKHLLIYLKFTLNFYLFDQTSFAAHEGAASLCDLVCVHHLYHVIIFKSLELAFENVVEALILAETFSADETTNWSLIHLSKKIITI